MIWASRWSVTMRTFYRQILSVLYSSFPFGNFRPRLVRALLVYTLQGINTSHLGKRKIIFKYAILEGYVSSLEYKYMYIYIYISYISDVRRRSILWADDPMIPFLFHRFLPAATSWRCLGVVVALKTETGDLQLGGGFKIFLFSPLPGEDSQFD